jgi:hypothetical protein
MIFARWSRQGGTRLPPRRHIEIFGWAGLAVAWAKGNLPDRGKVRARGPSRPSRVARRGAASPGGGPARTVLGPSPPSPSRDGEARRGCEGPACQAEFAAAMCGEVVHVTAQPAQCKLWRRGAARECRPSPHEVAAARRARSSMRWVAQPAQRESWRRGAARSSPPSRNRRCGVATARRGEVAWVQLARPNSRRRCAARSSTRRPSPPSASYGGEARRGSAGPARTKSRRRGVRGRPCGG